MAKRAGGESLAVLVYSRLRSEILNADLAPGERLKPAELGDRFDVSLSVVREALGLLAAKDLVQIDRNRGFRVMPLSLQALTDLTEARVVNEGAALRLSVRRGGVTWESEVLAAHHRLAGQPMFLPGDPQRRNEEWARAHLEFHHTLIQACGNAVLLDICTRLSDAAELYRAWSGPGTLENHRDVAGEHQGLVDAALAHDADEAAARFEAHVNRTRQILMDTSLAVLGDSATEPAP
ncbi:GntR family transcriptional regulator [Amycolatopsis sp. lyj-23]|uniref:GntR family transcriptional regulator n=1 Tax=Amycolatopsis sp. lyj-23 TaxID=2789283 RepID=UPI00397D2A03